MKIKNIFLIDADHFFASTFSKKLNRNGEYLIQYFESYEDAMHSLNSFCPDIILIEQDLKGLSGLESIPYIQKTCAGSKIVMVSNQNKINVVEAAYALGVSKYFRKDLLLLDHVEGLICELEENQLPNWKKLFV